MPLDGQAMLHHQSTKKRETIKKHEPKEKTKIMRNFAKRGTKQHTHTARDMPPNAKPNT
jgi:hypothetical protein